MTNYPKKPTKEDIAVELQLGNLDPKLKRSFIIHSFLLNIAIWSTFVYYLVVGETAQGLLIMMYLIYIVEALFAPILRYLWNLNKVEDIVSYVNRLKTYPPEISLYCECFHYETRTRWVTEYYTEYEQQYDYQTKRYETIAVQKSRQKQETYEEKIITYREREYFKFSRFDDISGNISNDIYKFQATKVDFSKHWKPGDEITANTYQLRKDNFLSRNRNRDRHFHFEECLDIRNFKAKALSIVDLQQKSILMSWIVYILCSIITLSWVYRKWLEGETVKGNFEFRKVVYL